LAADDTEATPAGDETPADEENSAPAEDLATGDTGATPAGNETSVGEEDDAPAETLAAGDTEDEAPEGEATGDAEEEPAEEAAALLYDGEELAFGPEEEIAGTEEQTEPVAEDEGDAEGTEEGEPLAPEDVLLGTGSVDDLLGEAETESSTGPSTEQGDSRDESGGGTEIVDIDTGVSLDNLTGGHNNTPDV